jgi:hypothetical protein
VKDVVDVIQKNAAGTRRHFVARRGGAEDVSKLGCAPESPRHQWRNSCREQSRQPGSRDNEIRRDAAIFKISPQTPNDGWLVAVPPAWQLTRQHPDTAGLQFRCARQLAAQKEMINGQTTQFL